MRRLEQASVQPTTGTGIHRQLLKAVRATGLSAWEEEPFGPYSVDIYVPEIRIAFEADGPRHSRRKDAERDAIILAEYGVRVVRFGRRVIEGSSLDVLTRLVRLAVEETDG